VVVCWENRYERVLRQDRCLRVKRSFGGLVCPQSLQVGGTLGTGHVHENCCEWIIRQDRCRCVKRSFRGLVYPRSLQVGGTLGARGIQVGGTFWVPLHLWDQLLDDAERLVVCPRAVSAARIVVSGLSVRIVVVALNGRLGAWCVPEAYRWVAPLGPGTKPACPKPGGVSPKPARWHLLDQVECLEVCPRAVLTARVVEGG
jgi:hypothetical protein